MTKFTKIGADGSALPNDSTDHIAVRHNASGLIFSRAVIGKKRLPWKRAVAAGNASDLPQLPGYTPWRTNEVEERILITDYRKYNPAIDTAFFDAPDGGFEWTATPDPSSPSDCAWGVYVSGGGVSWSGQGGEGWVRAVCGPAGQ